MDRLPEELRARFVREIVDRYLKRHSAEDVGMIHVGMMRLQMNARKRKVEFKRTRASS